MTPRKPMPPLDELNNIFDYIDGKLYWKLNKTKVGGKAAGYKRPPNYYTYIGYKSIYYLEHRLIYFMHHKSVPDNIDHIDGDVSNNKIENLRECTHIQNMYNVKTSKSNSSGFKGVSYYKTNKKWLGSVSIDGVRIKKMFDTIEGATEWTICMRKKHHGEFLNNGQGI